MGKASVQACAAKREILSLAILAWRVDLKKGAHVLVEVCEFPDCFNGKVQSLHLNDIIPSFPLAVFWVEKCELDRGALIAGDRNIHEMNFQ